MGFGFGFKIDSPQSGTYLFSQGSMMGGAPPDSFNSVTLVVDGNYVDWSSTLGIDAVYVKGGNVGGNLYIYGSETEIDAGLSTPGGDAGISHIEFCYDYELTASKTANPTYTRTYTWEIDKGVNPASHAMFIGESGTSEYTVAVQRHVEDDGFQVAGTIHVINATPFTAAGIVVTDLLDGTSVAVACPKASLEPGEMMTCTYSQALPGMVGALNTATVTTSNPYIGPATASAGYSWGEPTTVVGYPTIDVDDTNGMSWTVSDSATFSYTESFACSTDLAAYTNGFYFYVAPNTATIRQTGQNDSALVTVDCYAPVVTKNAATAYTRTFTWDIDKSVAPTSHTGFAGDVFESGYSVSVTRYVNDAAFTVAGTITVQNPNPYAAMIVSVTDSLTGAVLDCGGALVVPAGGASTCGYSAALGAAASGINVATITLNAVGVSAEAAYEFGEPTTIVGYPTVTVTDTRAGTLGVASGASTWAYPGEFACPTSASSYTSGVYTESVPNTAKIVETDQTDDGNVDLTCYLPAAAKVTKYVVDGPDAIGEVPFVFRLYNPSGVLVETANLSEAGDVTFATSIETAGTWKVVEVLPAGWVNDALECTFAVAFPASAGQTFACTFSNVEKSRVNVAKTTDGLVDATKAWTFALYSGGFDGTQLGTASTLGDSDGLLTFGDLALDPGGDFTLCELGVPSGWNVVWTVDADYDGVAETTVVPYNPNADDAEPADLGNRCIDLADPIGLVAGDALLVSVDNQYPGGEPRTPGYWKNWNRCTGGGQAANADRNGGWEEGFWLLEDALDPAIGGGIVWDDILVDSKLFPITTCAVAVDILDKRMIEDPAVVKDGKKASADAAYNLAAHLLAAQLNFAAGAHTCPAALAAAAEAEELLDAVNFNGTKIYLRNGANYNLANALAEALDDYNNGLLCP